MSNIMRAINNILSKLRQTPIEERKQVSHYIPQSTAGTEIYSGYYSEEYLRGIQGKEWAFIVDKMRRSNDVIALLLRLIKSPIKNATWSIDYKTENEEQQRMKELIEFSLFENINFKQFINEVTTNYEFGFSLFENIYTPIINHAQLGDALVLKKLSWINPKTIETWNLSNDGTLLSVEQQADGDLHNHKYIYGDYLSVFSFNKEGSNYEGISILRPLYGNYLRADHLLKVASIGHERSSLGVPIGTTAPGANDEAQEILSEILSGYTSNQNSNIVVPEGTTIESFKLDFDAQGIQNAIDKEYNRMVRSILAQFMELGSNGSGGSFALGSTQMSFFLSSLQSDAEMICYEINQKIIKPLIDFNFGKQEKYPKLKASNITDKIGTEFVDSLTKLTQAGYLAPSQDMQEFIRKKMNLPEAEIEDQENQIEKDNNSQGKSIEQEDINKTLSLSLELAEKKNNASKAIKDQGEILKEFMIEALTARRDKLLNNTRKILDNNKTKSRRKEVISQPIPDVKKYKNDITEMLLKISADATNQVKKELNLDSSLKLSKEEDLKDITSTTKNRLQSEVDLIVNSQDADLSKNLFFSFNNDLDNTDSTDSLIKKMKESSDKYINGPSILAGASNFASNAINNARNDVYHDKNVTNLIESFTIFNPDPKAPICQQLSGRTITIEEYNTGNLPPYHHNCNTIVIANLKTEKNNPPISPLGLAFTGTEKEVERIIKSNTL
jgi:phage gp29-like protein